MWAITVCTGIAAFGSCFEESMTRRPCGCTGGTAAAATAAAATGADIIGRAAEAAAATAATAANAIVIAKRSFIVHGTVAFAATITCPVTPVASVRLHLNAGSIVHIEIAHLKSGTTVNTFTTRITTMAFPVGVIYFRTAATTFTAIAAACTDTSTGTTAAVATAATATSL